MGLGCIGGAVGPRTIRDLDDAAFGDSVVFVKVAGDEFDPLCVELALLVLEARAQILSGETNGHLRVEVEHEGNVAELLIVAVFEFCRTFFEVKDGKHTLFLIVQGIHAEEVHFILGKRR